MSVDHSLVTSGVKVVQTTAIQQKSPSINITYKGSQVRTSFNQPQIQGARISQSQFNSSISLVHQSNISHQQQIRPMNLYQGGLGQTHQQGHMGASVPSHIGSQFSVPHTVIVNQQRPSNVSNLNVIQSLNRGPVMRY